MNILVTLPLCPLPITKIPAFNILLTFVLIPPFSFFPKFPSLGSRCWGTNDSLIWGGFLSWAKINLINCSTFTSLGRTREPTSSVKKHLSVYVIIDLLSQSKVIDLHISSLNYVRWIKQFSFPLPANMDM